MSDIRFDCPKCRTALVADWSLIGSVVRCPECKLTIPLRSDTKDVEVRVTIADVTVLEPSDVSPLTSEQTDSKLVGVDGLLLFFCISSTIFAPLWSLYNFSRSIYIVDQLSLIDTNAHLFYGWYVIVGFAVVIYGMVIGILVWNRRAGIKSAAVRSVPIRYVSLLVCEFLWLFYFKSVAPNVDLTGDAVSVLLANLIGMIFWLLYLTRSKRVKNTLT